MTTPTKVIAVIGATGAQGGSVVRYLLQESRFKVRAVVRNTQGEKADALRKLGVEVVQGDLNDVESLKRAFQGAYGVFGVTNFWEVFYDGEIRQGKNLGDAAKAAGVSHFVWSSLDHCPVPHFESKAQIGDYLNQIGVPTTHVLTSLYLEALLGVMGPKNINGVITWHIPMSENGEIFSFAVEDLGGWVREAFNHPEKYIGKNMLVATEYLSLRHLEQTFTKVTGKKAAAIRVPLEDFRKSGAPHAEELYLNMKWFADNPRSSGIRDVVWARSAHPSAVDWEGYLSRHPEQWKKL